MAAIREQAQAEAEAEARLPPVLPAMLALEALAVVQTVEPLRRKARDSAAVAVQVLPVVGAARYLAALAAAGVMGSIPKVVAVHCTAGRLAVQAADAVRQMHNGPEAPVD